MPTVPDRDVTNPTAAKTPRWKTRSVFLVAVAIPVGILGLLIAGLLVLGLGNPQWHKSIYLFQADLCMRGHEGVIPPPVGYTGQWVVWWSNGTKWMEYGLRNGKYHGPYQTWHLNGQKDYIATYCDGKRVGAYRQWYENGQKELEKTSANDGTNSELFTMWDKRGQIVRIERLVDGKVVEHIQGGPNP